MNLEEGAEMDVDKDMVVGVDAAADMDVDTDKYMGVDTDVIRT